MKKLMLVMLLGLSSTVALQAAERLAPARDAMMMELRENVGGQYRRFLGHAQKQDLADFKQVLQDVFPDTSPTREQHHDEEESFPVAAVASKWKAVGANIRRNPAFQEKIALNKETRMRDAQDIVAPMRVARDMKISALRGMVEQYHQEGNNAMLDFLTEALSGVQRQTAKNYQQSRDKVRVASSSIEHRKGK